MERNDWGFDLDARVVSVNELYELHDLLDEMWRAEFKKMDEMEHYEPLTYLRIDGTLSGIESSKKAVSDLISKAIHRLPMKQE